MKDLLRVSKPGFDLFQCKRDLIYIYYNPKHCNFVAEVSAFLVLSVSCRHILWLFNFPTGNPR